MTIIENPPLEGEPDTQPVEPSETDVWRVFASSSLYWAALVRQGLQSTFKIDTVRFGSLVHRTPALPKSIPKDGSVCGSASWRLTSSTIRDSRTHDPLMLQRPGSIIQWKVAMPRNQPVVCKMSQFSKFQFPDSKLQATSLLFMAWSYIFSMALLERQGIEMRYLPLASIVKLPKRHTCIIYLGEASIQEWRWWKALTSPGQGWQSTGDTIPPWAYEFQGDVHFGVTTDQFLACTVFEGVPPTSGRAMEYLSHFVSMYDLGMQSNLALAMVMLIPLHGQTGSTIELPMPSSFTESVQNPAPPVFFTEESVKLSHLMTFSSNPQFVSSALWSIFWEPGINCNLVSAWTEPIYREVEPLILGEAYEVLAHTFAKRNPMIAPLWYGVLACGKTEISEAILNYLRTLKFPARVPFRPIPEVASWTRSPQSFMDIQGVEPYIDDQGRVAREQVWRIRHECSQDPAFSNPPLYTWSPFGKMLVSETETEVREHLGCKPHHWEYEKWYWQSSNGTIQTDPGLHTMDNEGAVRLLLSSAYEFGTNIRVDIPEENIASKQATAGIFRWAVTEMEQSGLYIYRHPWVQAETEHRRWEFDGIEASEEEEDQESVTEGGVESWLGNLI